MKLIIAEKPSVAMSIANVVGATTKKDGFVEGNNYLVSWCVGHLVTSATADVYNEKYKQWDIDDLPILPTDYKFSVVPQTKKQFDILKNLMADERVSSLICATDSGREGELIFRLVYNFADCQKPVERLWISSLENSAIKKGMAELKPSFAFDNLYQSALARLKADWYVGINFSRLFSLKAENKITVGRVQTPVVNLIVERQREIDNFVATPYFVLSAETDDFIAKTEKIESKEEATKLFNLCKNQQGKIINIEEKRCKNTPPTLFDLTLLQRVANKRYGYTAQQVLDTIQSLYEMKLLTYPRTDSKYITEDMRINTLELINDLLSSSLFSNNIKNQYSFNDVDIEKVVDNSKVSDHHAIIPTQTALNKSLNLSEIQLNCFNLVVERLLEAVYKPFVYDETTVDLDINGVIFKAKGRKTVDLGYKIVSQLENEAIEDDTSISSAVYNGKLYNNIAVVINQKMTTPPKPYNDNTLLSAMENARQKVDDSNLKEVLKECEGIGTPATRSSIIEKIIAIGYVERRKKLFYPTEKGCALIDIMPESIKSVELTAQWEKKLKQIENGFLNADLFNNEICQYVRDTITQNQDLKVSVDTFKNKREVLCVCPRCGGDIMENSKAFSCAENCGIVLFKEDRYFKSIGKRMSKQYAKNLFSKGETVLKKCVSKNGKEYNLLVKADFSNKYVKYTSAFYNGK